MEFEKHLRSKDRMKPRVIIADPQVNNRSREFENFFEWDERDTNSIKDEEFSFKPLSSGLGFHNDSPSIPVFPRVQKELWEKPKYFSFEDAKKRNFRETDLEQFYEPTHEEVFEKIFSNVAVNEKREEFNSFVSPVRQFSAWTFDTMIVSALTLTNIMLMFVASDIPLTNTGVDLETVLLCSSLWTFWYLMYFTIMEYTGLTVGKKILGLKVKSVNQGSLDFTQAFIRSFFSLFSIATLGLFTMLKGPSIASKTEVYPSGTK